MSVEADTTRNAGVPSGTPSAAASALPDYMTVAELRAALSKREISPVDIVENLLGRIEQYESSLHCFVTLTPEVAREQACIAETRLMAGKPLSGMDGIPYGLKDVIDTTGIRTTGQSKFLENNIPGRDACVVEKLKESGGVLVGKMTTYEFAHGGPSWDLPWPPAMNPWAKGYLPGSTSSGPAAAVAAGLLPCAIGTDTGGSIRMPAAVCGIVGLKPTYGLVSRRGVLPNTYSFDACGPMTRTVEDAAIMLQAIVGYDDEDISSVDQPAVDYCKDLNKGVKGIRIGWMKGWYDKDANCHPDVAPAVASALRALEDAGAIVEEIELSSLLTYQDCKTTISITEMFTAYEHWFRTRPEDFGTMFRNKVMAGGLIRAEDYCQAQRQRLWLVREMARAFREFDIIATAGWMTVAEPARPDKLDRFLRPPNITTPFNVGGQPALNLPCGFSQEGLPLSLQLAGRHFEEAQLLRVAHAYQQMSDWHRQHPTKGLVQ